MQHFVMTWPQEMELGMSAKVSKKAVFASIITVCPPLWKIIQIWKHIYSYIGVL